MGKKFKGMYMQKCGLRDGSLIPVTALLAQGLTDSSFRYQMGIRYPVREDIYEYIVNG